MGIKSKTDSKGHKFNQDSEVSVSKRNLDSHKLLIFKLY